MWRLIPGPHCRAFSIFFFFLLLTPAVNRCRSIGVFNAEGGGVVGRGGVSFGRCLSSGGSGRGDKGGWGGLVVMR